MSDQIIGVISPGDMGHVVGGVLTGKGLKVLTDLSDRSALTKERAARSNMEDAGSLDGVISAASCVLSIMPPESAFGFAGEVAAAMKRTGATPLFVDCNAISPATTRSIQQLMDDVSAPFAKVGIIGPPPGRGPATKFYASGSTVDQLGFIDGDGISLIDMGADITRASAIKMCYAGLTKGKMTLHTAVLMAGEMLGISDELHAEIAGSQKADWEAMNARVPFYPCDAGRWSGEMDQISQTFGDAGVTPNLHKGAADVFRFLDSTPLSVETRETADRSRTLEQSLEIYADTMRSQKAAE